MEAALGGSDQVNKLASSLRGLQRKPRTETSRKTEQQQHVAASTGEKGRYPPPLISSHDTTATEASPPLSLGAAAPSSNVVPPAAAIRSRREMMRGERGAAMATSEESIMLKRIKDMHSPDGMHLPYDSKFVLMIIEEIVLRTSFVIPGIEQKSSIEARLEEVEKEILNSEITDLRDELAYPVNKIAAELIYKTQEGVDGRRVTEELFQSLANYSWEAKLVIAFGAFAKIYGEYWLVAALFTTSPLARSVGILMEIDEVVGTKSEVFYPKFRAITDLVNAMLDVTKSIFDFKDLLSKHVISPEEQEYMDANLHVPVAAYWTMRSIVACSNVLMNIMALGHQYISTGLQAWELGSLAHKLAQFKEHLQQQKNLYQRKLEEKRQHDAFLALVRLFEMPHLDNMKILKALFCAHDDPLPLYDGTSRMRVALDELRKKNVIILVSGLHIPQQEFDILQQLYTMSKQSSTSPESRYELVWLPVIDRSNPLTPETLQRFEYLQREMMPWYSSAHPSLIDPAVNRFIREVWKYDNRPLLVVLDPQGRVSNYNAFNMLWIWGIDALPFTDAREEALWNTASWNMTLLLDSIDSTVVDWLQNEKFICLYGGEDMAWIRKFTAATRNMARQLNLDLEMLYVGKSNPNDKVKRINDTIRTEQLSSTFPDMSQIWFFWVRLTCMWNSREKRGITMEYDDKLKEVITILTYDSSDFEWAIFGRGSTGETAKHMGEVVLQCVEDFSNWRSQVVEKQQLVLVLQDQLRARQPRTHCSRLFYPGASARAPHTLICPECGRAMEKHLMYRCCTD